MKTIDNTPLPEKDDLLYECNVTELLWIARRQGLGHLRRSLSKEVLVAIVTGEMELVPMQHLAGTSASRARLERFIWENIAQTRSQLPGCTGRCTEYPCTEGRHALCFVGNKDAIR